MLGSLNARRGEGGLTVPVLLRGREVKKKLFRKKGKNQTERREKRIVKPETSHGPALVRGR
jgi:hypothetical protein